jgi:hypothetical protein
MNKAKFRKGQRIEIRRDHEDFGGKEGIIYKIRCGLYPECGLYPTANEGDTYFKYDIYFPDIDIYMTHWYESSLTLVCSNIEKGREILRKCNPPLA